MPFIFFFLSKYLILDHENYTLWRVMVWLHTLFFREVCPLLRPCAKRQQVCICFVGTVPCPAHVAKFLLCESYHHQSQTPYHGFHPSGLQTGGNLRVLDQGCWVDGIKLCNKLLWWLPESSNVCTALHCHDEARFLLDSCESELIWNVEHFFITTDTHNVKKRRVIKTF